MFPGCWVTQQPDNSQLCVQVQIRCLRQFLKIYLFSWETSLFINIAFIFGGIEILDCSYIEEERIQQKKYWKVYWHQMRLRTCTTHCQCFFVFRKQTLAALTCCWWPTWFSFSLVALVKIIPFSRRLQLFPFLTMLQSVSCLIVVNRI